MDKAAVVEPKINLKTPAPIRQGKKKIIFNKKVFALATMIMPTIILKFVFQYLPLYGLLISFQNFKPFLGIRGSEWVGLKNFQEFLTDPKFWAVMRNTVVLNFYHLIFVFWAPILFALLVNEVAKVKFKKIVQTISYLPHFLSWVVVAGIINQVLSPGEGLINIAIKALGHKPIYFLASAKYFRSIIIVADIWKGVGWGAVLYFAQIAGIDSALYEAAEIDGAGRLKQIFYITLPGMAPMIILQLLLTLSRFLNIGFDKIFLLQNAMTKEVSDVLSVYIYQLGLVDNRYSLTTAMGMMFSLLGYITLRGANKLSKIISGMGLY
jgi:putative aldouronate transport system permease protein